MLDPKLKRELGLTLPAVLTLEQRDLKDQVNIVKYSKKYNIVATIINI